VPLSELGQRQADAMSAWFKAMPLEAQPTVVLFSPYVRARATARAVLDQLGRDSLSAVVADERLREKEFGILDRLTPLGINDKYPGAGGTAQARGQILFPSAGRRELVRRHPALRSTLDTITREYRGERVLIVGHQVIVNCFRYLLERMDEDAILAIDRAGDVPNCGITEYRFDPGVGKHGKLVLVQANFVAPLEDTGTPVTHQPDLPAAPKS
jgi:broad specificity phosphatase PhoE